MEDLYSDTTDSFTVGMASGPLTGVAIFSFARYDPLFSIKYTKQAGITLTNHSFPLLFFSSPFLFLVFFLFFSFLF